MPKQLKYVAQLAMDLYYQNYKGENDFWELGDFIQNCGNTAAKMYLTFYQQDYAMLRQDKKEEVVSFDAGWLLEQDAEVTGNGIFKSATLEYPVMTFPYDRSSCGLQHIFPLEPLSFDELQRTSLSALYQLKYVPKTNDIYFYSDVSKADCDTVSKIGILNKGNCNIKKIKVYYVPVLNDENANVPDGIISDVVANTVLMMKQIEQGTVVDMTENQNSNKILQTELDKATLTK